MTKPARFSRTTSEPRNRKIRAVLAACRRLGLNDDDRKAVQLQVTGTASMSAMEDAQLGKLLDHLNRDWQGTNPQRPHLAKIKALWWSLYWLGAIEEPGEKALSAFVNRQTGVATLRFLDSRKAYSVIEALKQWLEREGVNWATDEEIEKQKATWPNRDRAASDRWAVIHRLDQVMFSTDVIHHSGKRYAAEVLGLTEHWSHWTVRQLDDVIRVLGKKWRAERPKMGGTA